MEYHGNSWSVNLTKVYIHVSYTYISKQDFKVQSPQYENKNYANKDHCLKCIQDMRYYDKISLRRTEYH